MKKILLVIFIFIHYTISSQWKTAYSNDEFGDKTENTYKYLNAFGTFSNSATQGERLMCKLRIFDEDDLFITVYEYNDKLATFISYTWEDVKLKSPDGKVHSFGVWFSSNGTLVFSDKPPYNVNDSFDKNSVTKYNYTRVMEALKQKGIHKIIFNRTSDMSAVDSSYKISFTINSGFSSKALDSKIDKMNKEKSELEKTKLEKTVLLIKKKALLKSLIQSIKNEKLSESSLLNLESKIKDDLGIGPIEGKGTGLKYKSITIEPHLDEAFFELFGYVNLFYELEDGSVEMIDGRFIVEDDAPILKLHREKLNVKDVQKGEKTYSIITLKGLIKAINYRITKKKGIIDVQKLNKKFIRLKMNTIISIKQNGKELLIN